MNVVGKIKVKAKANEVTGRVSYRTSMKCTDKDGNDQWETWFINLVQGAKNMPIDNDSYIIIKKGFITFSKNSEGKTIYSLAIQDFDYDDSTSSISGYNPNAETFGEAVSQAIENMKVDYFDNGGNDLPF